MGFEEPQPVVARHLRANFSVHTLPLCICKVTFPRKDPHRWAVVKSPQVLSATVYNGVGSVIRFYHFVDSF